MGDRAVAGFRSGLDDPTIFIYQHWSGSQQHANLANALQESRPRWDDDSYATRIALSQLIGDTWNSETGYGIYVGKTSHGADYPFCLIVDWEARNVLVCSNDNSDTVLETISFEDFIENHYGKNNEERNM